MFGAKSMHQQHVNCLINTWGLLVKTWLLISCDTAFYAIILANGFGVTLNYNMLQRAAGSSLTGVTALWSLSKTHLS